MASKSSEHTVFLTEEEAKNIKTTVQDRRKQCSERAGQAREPRDAKDARSQATGAALMADMGQTSISGSSGSGGTIPALSVGEPYPPCIVASKDLKEMKLSELKMETHHRGYRITVTRLSTVVTLAARSWTMVQDEEEGTERLEICLHKTMYDEEILEMASDFIIKEPYFTLTEDGEPTIRIDHPSDLIVLQLDPKDTKVRTATKLKDEGNKALEKNDFSLAHAKYSKGLEVAISEGDTELAQNLYRNRAHVNLALNQLDEAISDAKASLINKDDAKSKELDSKAYFRAGSAAYNLGDFQLAKGFFDEQLKLTPDNPNAVINVKRIQLRLNEQENGKYNLKKTRANLSKARPWVEAANFTRNVEVRDSPGRGNGLFAARDIPAGEIVLAEKAFCVVWGHGKGALTAMTYDVRDDKIRVSAVGLDKAIVQKLLCNPSQMEKTLASYGDYKGDGKNVSGTVDGPVVDVFRVHDIVCRNAFGPGSQFGEESASRASTGLWTMAAYANHSCMANVSKEYVGDLLFFRADRPIAAGDEICHSYDESTDYDARQRALMTTWGFECDCALCKVEKAEAPAVRAKRRELAADAVDFVQREPWANTSRVTIVKARRLAKALEDTYDEKKYKGLPRLATLNIQNWLANADTKR